jgi:cyclic-di-GMP phosphodiesterase TipF (flagellum assembly factor)
VQALVYIFIALACLAIAGAAYFGLTFTPIEAIVTALVFGAIAVLVVERSLRQRAENRLEKAIEDLSRLLSTDAQAGSVLSQRINAIADQNPGKRLDAIEADISVLGTVIRQVAEAVADLEEARRAAAAATSSPANPIPQPPPPPQPQLASREPEPVITLELLKQAIDENRLIHHIQPIITLPHRRPHGYDLVPRLMLGDGDLADSEDFMPRRGGEDIIRRIEAAGLYEAITIARRARSGGQPIALYVPLSRASLGDAVAMEAMLATLDANAAVTPMLIFRVSEADWRALLPKERAAVASIARTGVTYSIAAARSLRVDFNDLAGSGVRSIRVDAAKFIDEPQIFTDFHTSDIAAYTKRFEVDLIMTGIASEQQTLTLLEDGIGLVQGPHIAGPGPVRADLLVDRSEATRGPRRAEV